MKSILTTLRPSNLFLLMICLAAFSACQKEISHQQQTSNWGSTDVGSHSFRIQSDNMVKTGDGFKFTGNIYAKTADGLEFQIGKGNYEVVADANNTISTFKGQGMAKFPDVGLFAEMMKSFNWKPILSRIEYNTGAYFKDHYKTDIPLTDDRKYLHFQVLDESKDGPYNLKHVANTIIYKFFDLYIDPGDPAVYAKVQLLPDGDGDNAKKLISTFWNKIKELGKGAFEFADSKNVIMGISNNGTFRSKPYKFTVMDAQKFKEEFGYDAYQSLPSHLYFKIAGVPIPGTGILQCTGEAYVHYPFSSLLPQSFTITDIKSQFKDVIDFLTWKSDNGYALTLNGSIDPGAKGIGLVLGMLPNINQIVGKEIFGEDFNIDLVGASLQFQVGSSTLPSFFRFSSEIKVPVIANLFGPDIKKYLSDLPTATPSSFAHYNLGPTIEEISYYTETAVRMRLPFYGDADMARTRILINKEGIKFNTKLSTIGPLQFSNEIKGKIARSGFELNGITTADIVLPNGVKLLSNNLNVKLSSDSGITVNGSSELPFGLGKGELNGKLTKDGLTLKGKLNAGGVIDLGSGFVLPTANMEFSVSTNPSEGIYLKGNVTVPRVGSVAVTGYLNDNDFLLEGKVSVAQMNFGPVGLPYGDGELSISKSKGVSFKGNFDLGLAFGKISMQGTITNTNINLSGSLRNTIVIAGHSFTLANGTIVANNAGVKVNGNINLYIFSTSLSGSIYGKDNFEMDGQYSYNGTFVKATIKVEVKPGKVELTGTGRIYGALGNELYNGTLSFYPDWNARTIRVCYTVLGVQACLNL